MYKSAGKFQLSQPARQFFTEHSGLWSDQEADQTSLRPISSPLSRLREGTRRIGVEYYLRNKVSDVEVVALLFQLMNLDCIVKIDTVLFQELDQRLTTEGELFCFLIDQKNQVIKLICNGLAVLDTRPLRHPINWSTTST